MLPADSNSLSGMKISMGFTVACRIQSKSRQMTRTHLLVKVDRVAHEGRMVDEVEARPVLWHVTLEKQLLSQLYAHPWIKHSGVPQAVDHDDDVVVELTESLAADVKGLLRSTFPKGETKKVE